VNLRGVRIASLAASLVALASIAGAQGKRGVILDQTNLPLPGVRVEVHRGDQVIQNTITGADGTFELVPGPATDTVEAALEGFETTRVPRSAADRITLKLAATSDVVQVVASALTSSGSSMEHLGSTMSASVAQRLPAPRPRILQALPLLPAVIRGRDGLLRIGGTRPHESALWIDGFDVTDPVTLTSAIDLPNESVKGMAVVREPVSATFSGVLGSMASIETTAGTGEFRGGIQGFIPRPRLNAQYGLGKIEAFFPRAYVGGGFGPRARYFASVELNFERVPVPGVTTQSGTPAVGATGVVSFARVDFDLTPSNTLTVEGLFLPANSSYTGLSPLQQPEAAPDVDARDLFGGVVDRMVLTRRDLLTVRIGFMNHLTHIRPAGSGDAVLRPDGWQQNWFSAVETAGSRPSASITWDRSGIQARGTHTFSLTGDLAYRTMSSEMSHQRIRIEDDLGNLTRSIDFEPLLKPITLQDFRGGAGIRDLWDVSAQLQLDFNLRFDGYRGEAGVTPSPRVGVRYNLDADGRTTVKASAGRFIGRPPLGAQAFGAFPSRLDRSYTASGALASSYTYRPVARSLLLPRSDGVTLELERRIRPGLEAQAAVRVRKSTDLPTVMVGSTGGDAVLGSAGDSVYREFQISVNQTWSPDAQLFVSYVHASSETESNDFGSMFTNLDAPLLEPNDASSPSISDTPHRLRAWATFSLPYRVVVSPAVDWRTGFPYSIQDMYRHYVGGFNTQRLPVHFTVDLTTFKTFDVFTKKMDLGLQVFNLTNHFNPRDVISVINSPRFRELTNNPGVTFGGYMQVRW
jgi:Carboxypeptidase regulatory-like domain